MGNILHRACVDPRTAVAVRTVAIVVPCATVPRRVGAEQADAGRMAEIEDVLVAALTVAGISLETRIPDLRALAAALALRRAFEAAGYGVLLLANEVAVVDADEQLRYVGDAVFQERVRATLRTRRLALVLEVHSFATRGLPGDVLPAGEVPPTNWYCFTPTGREMGMPGCVERRATDEHVLLHWARAETAASYVVLEFFQHVYQYQPESLRRDAQALAAWAVRSGR